MTEELPGPQPAVELGQSLHDAKLTAPATTGPASVQSCVP